MDLILLWALVAFILGQVDCKCNLAPVPKKANRSIVYTCSDATLQDLQEISSNAQWIEISVSQLRNIPDDTFLRFRDLRRLHFYNCRIDFIAEEAFRGLLYLNSLVFHGTKLNVARAAWFKRTPNLKELVLDSCELVYVEPDLFRMLPRLETLSLRDNDLNCLSLDELATLRDLKTVKIDGNPWHCECRSKLEEFFRARRIVQVEKSADSALIRPIGVQCMTELRVFVVPSSVTSQRTKTTMHTEEHSVQRSSVYKTHSESFQTTTLDSLDRLSDTITWIRISNLVIDRIPPHLFFRFGSTLRSLEFRNCDIGDVDPDAFGGLYKLQQLAFVDSRLRRIEETWFTDLVELQQLILVGNEIQFIEDGAFAHLWNSLRFLDVRNSHLYCLPIQDLAKLTKLEKLDATDNPFTCSCRTHLMNLLTQKNVGYNINVGECVDNVNEIDTWGNAQIVSTTTTGRIDWTTIQTSTTTNTNETVSISRPPLKKPPPPIPFHHEGRCSPDISDDSIYRCTGLKSFELLNTVPHTVHTLHIIHSDLTEVPSLAFVSFNNYLRRLELRNCGIRIIGPKAFAGLWNLEYLSLRNNSLQTIVSTSFEDLSTLRFLDLSQNRITTVQSRVFDLLRHVTHLDLSENSLNCVDVGHLSHRMIHLKTIKGNGNPWHCVCGMRLAKLAEERRLHSDMKCWLEPECICRYPESNTETPTTPGYFNYTPTAGPQETNVEGTCNIQEDASGVRYICTGGNLPLLWSIPSHVTVIEFHDGNLPYLPSGTLSKFHNLRELTIVNSKLKHVENGAFDGLNMLKILTIQGNPLTNIGTSSLVLPNLERLDLRDNSLNYISGGTFKHLENLEYLNLEGNNLKCIFTSDLNDMPNLKVIAFSSNLLRWRCRLELEQFLEMKGIKYVKIEESCDGRKIARYMQNRTNSVEGDDCEPIDCNSSSIACKIQYANMLLLLTFAFIGANCGL